MTTLRHPHLAWSAPVLAIALAAMCAPVTAKIFDIGLQTTPWSMPSSTWSLVPTPATDAPATGKILGVGPQTTP